DTAFAQHTLLRTMRDMATWFCDAYASWQKGGVENANGRLRRCLNSDAKCNTPALGTYSIFLSSEPPSHLRNAAEGGGEEGKIRSFLGKPELPKVLHFASESTPSSDALSLHSRRAHGEYSGRPRSIPSRLG